MTVGLSAQRALLGNVYLASVLVFLHHKFLHGQESLSSYEERGQSGHRDLWLAPPEL
jgi:hypothetical protein